MKNGVVNVVITDTATITGYKNPLVTPRPMPRFAMIKENSPICVWLMAPYIEVRRSSPAATIPSTKSTAFPTITAIVKIKIGIKYSTSIDGTTISPTDTKNTAPNKSLHGATRCSTRSPCMVPARMEPARKAPNAVENPMASASHTIAKQMPSDVTKSVSSLINSCVFCKNDGIR